MKLNIDEYDNSLDFSLAMDVAPFFRLKKQEANDILNKVRQEVAEWHKIAESLGIKRDEQEYMAQAFRNK